LNLLRSPHRMRTILILASALTLASGQGCGGRAGGEPADRVSVVASFYPLSFVAERLGGQCVSVTNLTPAGTEPHDLELTPDAVGSIATADVVLYLGGGFQPAIEEAVRDAEGRTVDVLAAVAAVPAEGEEAEDGIAVDPHVWLDPARFSDIVTATADALEGIDLPASCGLAAATERLRSDLGALDEEFRTGLSGCDHDAIVTSHAAFGYLADAYGLRQEAIAGLEPEVEPTPIRMAEIVSLVRREGVTTIFTEELVSPDVAETLAAEAGVETAVLYTIEGLTQEDVASGDDYLSLMRENLDALRAALRCP
jgi:zinc transport system substrate-binding protein